MEFDLPLEILYKTYVESDIVKQLMGTKLLNVENKKHGSYQFETTNAKGKLVFQANGANARHPKQIKITHHGKEE